MFEQNEFRVLILSEMRLPLIDIYHRIRKTPLDEKPELIKVAQSVKINGYNLPKSICFSYFKYYCNK